VSGEAADILSGVMSAAVREVLSQESASTDRIRLCERLAVVGIPTAVAIEEVPAEDVDKAMLEALVVSCDLCDDKLEICVRKALGLPPPLVPLRSAAASKAFVEAPPRNAVGAPMSLLGGPLTDESAVSAPLHFLGEAVQGPASSTPLGGIADGIGEQSGGWVRSVSEPDGSIREKQPQRASAALEKVGTTTYRKPTAAVSSSRAGSKGSSNSKGRKPRRWLV